MKLLPFCTFAIIGIFFLLPGKIQAQKMLWADHLIGYSSQGATKTYSAEQALGAPNVYPASGDCGCAWAPNRTSGGREYIKVGFAKSIRAKRVAIAESYNPGAIEHIFLYDANNTEYEVYNATDSPAVRKRGRLLQFEIPKTKYKVSGLKLVLNTDRSPGFNQIDAIGLSAGDQPAELSINHASDFEVYSEMERLGAEINTKYTEILPRFSPDGQTLFFDRKDHPENYGGDDIWYTNRLPENGWTPSVNAGSPLNNPAHNYVCGMSDDLVITLANTYPVQPGDLVRPGVSQTFKSSSGWIYPLPMLFEHLYTGGLYAEYFMNRDRTVLLLSIEDLHTVGGKDIYVSFSSDKLHWTEPQNLGEMVNTAGQEMAPWLDPDGRTLYFSSNGLPGYGDQDVFRTTRTGNGWDKWTRPENLGPSVNSPYYDSHFVIEPGGENAWMSSTREDFANADLYRIRLIPPEVPQPEEEIVEENELVAEHIKEVPKPFDQKLLLFGYIQNALDGSYVPANLHFVQTDDPDRQQSVQTINAQYQLKLADQVDYEVMVTAPGFDTLQTSVQVSDFRNGVSRRDFRLVPIGQKLKTGAMDLSSGNLIRLETIQFDANSAVLKPTSYLELDQLADAMKSKPSVFIEIGGHTNGKCARQFCDRLSKARAKRVVEYLNGRGIDAERMMATGYGKSQPIADNKTREGREQNQRVEIKVKN